MANMRAGFLRNLLWAFFFVAGTAVLSYAQGDTANQAVGLPMHGSFSGSNFDNVQLNNGNLHAEIPLYSVGGRGLSMPVSLVYDSKGWYEYTLNSNQGTPVYVYPRGYRQYSPGPAHNMAWSLSSPLNNGDGRSATPGPSVACVGGNVSTLVQTYREPNGTAHTFPPHYGSPNICNLASTPYDLATDGSGYMFVYSGANAGVYAKDGTRIYSTYDSNNYLTSWILEDSNGNKITRAVAHTTANNPYIPSPTIVDTLGRTQNNMLALNSATGKYELKYFDSYGNQQTIQFTMTTVSMHTSLCGAQNTGSDGPCNEWVGSWQAPSVIQLPNGQQYTISYVQNSHGQIDSIQLPTGATISYTWGGGDDAGIAVKSRTVTSDGQTATWNYTYASGGTVVTATDPLGNDTVHTFQAIYPIIGVNPTNYDVLDKSYQGPASSNVLLKTVQTVYQANLEGPHLPLSVTTTWNQQGGLVSRTETDYYTQSTRPPYSSPPSWGNVTEKREYTFGVGAYGALARKTDYQYAHISGNTGYNVNYLNLGIGDRVTQKTVYDGSGSKIADAKTVYDGTAPSTTSGVPNHDYTIGNYRGNPSQTSSWVDTTNTWVSTNNIYSDLGHVLSTTDPGGHTTSFDYTDSWATAGVVSNCGAGSNTQAFVTQVSAPDTVNSQGATVHHRSQTTYFPCTGQNQSTRDENDILAGRSGTTYAYDLMLRPFTVTRTDGGQTSYSYNDTPNSISVTTATKQDSSHNIIGTSYHDGLGRAKQTQMVDPSDGDTFVDTAYDLLGRVATVSNPHRAVGLTTDGYTEYQYDALGRKVKEIPPDGSGSANNVQTIYGGDANGVSTTVIDQAGKARKSYSDALGRLVRVDEPGVTPTAPTSGTVSTGSISITGSLQSTVAAATPGTGAVNISGTIQQYTKEVCSKVGCIEGTYYETGSVSITVNGFTKSASFGSSTDNTNSLAAALAAAFNSDAASPVTATSTGPSVYLTSKITGVTSNYPFSAAAFNSQNLGSFSASAIGLNLSGGANARTVNDSGDVSVSVGSFTASIPFSSTSNSSSTAIASTLAATFNGNEGSPVTATVSGSTVSLTSRAPGSAANYAVVATSSTSQSRFFAAPSFAASNTTMAGGTDSGSSGDPTGLGTPATTLYTYNARDNLLCVVQKGTDTTAFTSCAAAPVTWRPRSFTYDSLSRLLTAKNPESGLITWTYDSDSNVLTKKDARNVTITYNYDQLHRTATVGAIHAKSYSNGDHAVDYFFDQTSYNGLMIAEGIGRQTGMADITGSSGSTFDTEGRVTIENKTINVAGLTPSAVTKQLSYTYNLDGSNTSITYPDGKVINYTYNSAARTLSAIDPSGPVKYVTAATYSPHGEVSGYLNGVTSSFTGIQTTNAWNNRFQPQMFSASTQGSSGHTVMSLSFNFNQGTSGAPIDNSLLVKINNNVNTGRNVNYSYDQLNRIKAAWHDASDWGAQYALDIWGNMYQKAPCNNTVGCPTRTSGEAFSAGANGNNQFNTYAYDASGNMLNDQLGHTFSYDAENRPYSAGGVTYYYDGAGERVAKSTGKLYLFGTDTAPVVETDASGTVTAEYIFFNGKRVAMKRMSDSTVHYYFADQIGSANVVTNATGTPEQDIEYHPYGEQQVYTDTLGQQYKFTGREHDPETNDDYFGARFYSSTFGRFLTPDWSAAPEAIPYAHFETPQTLNLYAYVSNNPLTSTDPDGHDNKTYDLGKGYTGRADTGNPNDSPNIHVFKRGSSLGKVKFTENGPVPEAGLAANKTALKKALELAERLGIKGRAPYNVTKPEGTGIAKGGSPTEEGGGGAAMKAFAILQVIDVAINAWGSYLEQRNSKNTGFYHDPFGKVIVTDLGKFGENLSNGTQVEFQHQVFTFINGSFVGSDGTRLTQDKNGNLTIVCSDPTRGCGGA